MKKTYIQPKITCMHIQSTTSLLVNSNEFTGTSVGLNADTMEGGDGNDAASRSHWGDFWDSKW